MAIINRLPSGFLSFLDQQTQGQNPKEPAPGLLVTTDITAHYRAAKLAGLTQSANVNTATDTLIVTSSIALLVVPEGEVWEVFGASTRFNMPTAVAANMFVQQELTLVIPSLAGAAGANVVVQSLRKTLSAGTSTVGFLTTSWQPPQRLILTPGIAIFTQISESAGLVGVVGAITQTLQVGFYRWTI